MAASFLAQNYESLQSEAVQLAGGLKDLAQRATVYHHLFRASGRNHAFPLIAAHGALWAGGYFRFGMRLGRLLSLQFALSPQSRREKLQQLEAFANAFRDINRRVCVDSYINFHFTARFGDHPDAAEFVPAALLEALTLVHQARRACRELSDAEKRTVFEAHFRHEQTNVVGPAVAEAVAGFDWPVVRFVALRPLIRFAYFPRAQSFWFRDFSRQEERIEKGLAAFDLAAQVGWRGVESTLAEYQVLPDTLFTEPIRHFAKLRAAILGNEKGPVVA